MVIDKIPKYTDLLRPTLVALSQIGGSASIDELGDEVAKILQLSSEVLEIPHNDGPRSEFEYRSAWARTHLKFLGAVDNSARGVWSLTEVGQGLLSKSDAQIKQLVGEFRTASRLEKARVKMDNATASEGDETDDLDVPAEISWEDRLLARLREISPAAFERLCQRLLREAGFSKVEVTGRSGDGGIDGSGVLRVNLLSFHVRFQCKRYAGAVSSPEIRAFRGAMVGRADKGLFLTTGRFTADAEREAVRDGAPAIDLIDGAQLCRLLKQYELGVKTKLIEAVEVDGNFYDTI